MNTITSVVRHTKQAKNIVNNNAQPAQNHQRGVLQRCMRWLAAWLLVASAATGCGAAPTAAPIIGQPAPNFALTTTTGATVQLSALRGKPVVVNFFATWCTPCREELPLLERVSQAVSVIGVDPAEESAAVARFGSENGVSYPLLLDADNAVKETYRVGNLPATFFVDKDGVLQGMVLGILSESKLREQLQLIGVQWEG